MIEQPTTWSYKTTKVLLISFLFFLIVPIIGISTQADEFEELTNPEKTHPSHMISLGNNESSTITLYSQNIYTVFVKSSDNVNNNGILLIDQESQNDLKPNSTSIVTSLFNENGETYDAVATWVFIETREVELQNSAGGTIWLINESEMINSLQENDILIGSLLGCLTSICLIPVIIVWFVINRPNPKALNIKIITNDSPLEEPTHLELLKEQDRIPNTDELYRAIHGNEKMKETLKIEIKEEKEKNSIPAPFVDRPDGNEFQRAMKAAKKEGLRKEEQRLAEEKRQDLPKTKEYPEETSSDKWKEWDG